MRTLLGTIFAVLCFLTSAQAATYYLSDAGDDGADGLSEGNAWLTWAYAWSQVSGGDTVIVLDGSFSDSPSPPSGKAGTDGNEITFQAQNDGEVTLTNQLHLQDNEYLIFQGFTIIYTDITLFVEGGGSTGATYTSRYNQFKRMGFKCTSTGTSPEGNITITDGSNNNLFEDIWVWGAGRYKMLFYGGDGGGDYENYGADSNTIRRAVIRYDAHQVQSGEPQGGISFYYASSNLAENVLVLDGLQSGDTTKVGIYVTCAAAFGATECSYNKVYGSIILNNTGSGMAVDVASDGTGQFNELKDSVIWDTNTGFYGLSINASGGSAIANDNLVQHVTIGQNTQDGVYNNGVDTDFSDTLITENTGTGFNSPGSVDVFDYNQYYSNTAGDISGESGGLNDLTNSDPQSLYLPQIESGTPGYGTASDAGDRGATVLFQYQDGSETASDLWPWTYESRIFQEMCTDSGITRGFCSSATLTDYIWAYLGNESPYATVYPDIHGVTVTGVTVQ